jgi:hypothetical protein
MIHELNTNPSSSSLGAPCPDQSEFWQVGEFAPHIPPALPRNTVAGFEDEEPLSWREVSCFRYRFERLDFRAQREVLKVLTGNRLREFLL